MSSSIFEPLGTSRRIRRNGLPGRVRLRCAAGEAPAEGAHSQRAHLRTFAICARAARDQDHPIAFARSHRSRDRATLSQRAQHMVQGEDDGKLENCKFRRLSSALPFYQFFCCGTFFRNRRLYFTWAILLSITLSRLSAGATQSQNPARWVWFLVSSSRKYW